MERAAWLARAGNRILNFLAGIIVLLLLLYGGYSLWDTYVTYSGAFAGSDLLKYKPAKNSADNTFTFEELCALNPDVRAWLTVDGTKIDYPVVQGKDDMEYVNKDVYGEFSLSGAIFLSYHNSPDFSDPYNLLYGHHMDNHGMFGDVMEYADSAFFEKNTGGMLYLPDGDYHISFFACVKTDAYDSKIFDSSNFKNEDLAPLLSHIGECSVQYRDIGIKNGDHLIALSTCDAADTNGRTLLFGRIDEK